MTDMQRVEIRTSEIRSELATLGKADIDSDGMKQVDQLTGELQQLESRRRALIASESPAPPEDGAPAETRALQENVKVGNYLQAAMDQRAPDGAEAEYSAAHGLSPGAIPLELWGESPETRAITPAPSSTVVQDDHATVPAIFRRTASARMGVTMPMVPPGVAAYPALTTAPTVDVVAKDAAAPNTAGAYSVTTRTPSRVQGTFEFRLEDRAILPQIESDLRMAISDALGDEIDDQILTGTGSTGHLTGLFSVASDVAAPSGSAVDFAGGVTAIAGLVDGTHAYGWGDIRVLIGTTTWTRFASLITSGTATSLSDYLMARLGAYVVSSRAPAVASDAQKGLAVLTAGSQMISAPVWSGMQMLVDPYSAASKGHVQVHATTLVGSPFVPYSTAMVKELHFKVA